MDHKVTSLQVALLSRLRRFAWFYVGTVGANTIVIWCAIIRRNAGLLNLGSLLVVGPAIIGGLVVMHKKARRLNEGKFVGPTFLERIFFLATFFIAGLCAEIGYFLGLTLANILH